MDGLLSPATCGAPSQELGALAGQEPADSLALRPRRDGTSLTRWLCEEIRAAILAGRLAPGSKLPSRSVIAQEYGLARGTVIAALDQLVKQGYLNTTVGRGTYVRDAPPRALPEARAPRGGEPRRVLSARGRGLAAQSFPRLWSNRLVETFRLDRPALDAFPVAIWNRLAVRRLQSAALDLLDHGDPLGFLPLRAAIAGYIGSRGVRCTAEQVVITSGTQQTLDLVARLLLDRGDQVWMEDPGYPAAAALLRAHGAEVIPVPVDAQGLNCDFGRQRGQLARLAYVTPRCQFPLGVPMSHARRSGLLQWADDAGAWIFEDDYDSLLRIDGPPPPLYGLDRASSVIYSNSFNRVLFPSLRLGFLVLPAAFIEPAAAALSITGRYRSGLDQAILSDFIEQGHLELHARQMRELYAARREALLAAAKAELGGLVQLRDSQCGGLQMVAWLAKGLDEGEAWRRAAAHRINSVALSSFALERPLPAALVLGIGSADERTLRTGIKRLRRVLRGVQLASGS
jgi:GntR family transcriptional regulator/MocR family aminotransferase